MKHATTHCTCSNIYQNQKFYFIKTQNMKILKNYLHYMCDLI